MTPFWKLDVGRDVQMLKLGFAGLIAVFGLAFWFVMARMDGRFDRMDDRSQVIAKDVGELKTENARQFERILVRLPNEQSQRTPQQSAIPNRR